MSHESPERCLARADLCRFLAACYYEPGPEFAEERLFDSMLAAARATDIGIAASVERLGALFFADPLDTLLVDYARLFLGPPEMLARPYGSFWLTGEKTLMQDATMAILALYREAGFDMDNEFRELPDHIGVELEFLYLLNYRAAEALRNQDERALSGYAVIRRRLLEEHLGLWVPQFAVSVTDNAATGFYRELSAVTSRVVAHESQAVF